MKIKRKSSEESQRLRQLVQEMGLPLRHLPDIIEETPEDCLSWWSDRSDKVQITGVHFERMGKFVGIPEDKLFLGDYDRDLARRRIYGEYEALPERYASNQNSFVRTSAHIHRYIKLTRGQAFADQVLTSLNLSPLLYLNPETKINLTYFADLLEALHKNGFSQQEMDTFSGVLFLSLQQTSLGEKFRNAQNTFEVYETLAPNFGYFDSNFDCRSQFVKDKYILTTILPIEHHTHLRQDPARVHRLMRYRQLSLAWVPYIAGLTPLFPKVEVVRSNSGILETRYEFTLKQSKRHLSLQAL